MLEATDTVILSAAKNLGLAACHFEILRSAQDDTFERPGVKLTHHPYTTQVESLRRGGYSRTTAMSAMLNKEEVIATLQRHAEAIRACGVKSLGLFGSFVHGNALPASDVDLLVDFEPRQKTFDNFIALSVLLERLLQRRVDLVTRESLSPYIGPFILRQVEDVTLAA